jgi:hypothetical protein
LHIRIIGITHGKSETQLGETAIDVSKYYNKTHHKLDLAINHPAFQLVCKISIVDLTKGIDFDVDVQSVLKNEKLQSISQADAMKIRANSLVYHEKKKADADAKKTTSIDIEIEKTEKKGNTTTVTKKTIEIEKTKSGGDAMLLL